MESVSKIARQVVSQFDTQLRIKGSTRRKSGEPEAMCELDLESVDDGSLLRQVPPPFRHCRGIAALVLSDASPHLHTAKPILSAEIEGYLWPLLRIAMAASLHLRFAPV
ncbi:hypothetical protein LSTR_LSTR017136 [Laodelphax striatellus]|uniref:Uncharacterized protein n=1 Tax=Laodelphax striatellus TaxID=195883 RepID=A0A482XKS1_LAOST|nr:hypothetical protein LSTR_LSTR017136 [Laodelphax striatellus]